MCENKFNTFHGYLLVLGHYKLSWIEDCFCSAISNLGSFVLFRSQTGNGLWEFGYESID